MLALRLPLGIEPASMLSPRRPAARKAPSPRSRPRKFEEMEDYAIAVERLKNPGKGIPLSELLAGFADDLDKNP